MDWVLGCDASRHQGKIDFAKMRRAGAEFVILRSSMGTGGVDSMWDNNYALARASGLIVGAYHLFFPELSPTQQVTNFQRVTAGKKIDLPVVVDVEINWEGRSPAQVAASLHTLLAYLPKVNGLEPTIYTRAEWWKRNVAPSSLWKKYFLHIARYARIIHPWADDPDLHPRDWLDWKFWQFSADGNGRGEEFGVESDSVDLNWYQGSLADLKRWIGLFPPVPVPDPEPPAPVPPVECGRVLVNGLRLRAGPSTQNAITATLAEGEIVQILERPTVWGKVRRENGQVGYVALVWNGKQYVERVT